MNVSNTKSSVSSIPKSQFQTLLSEGLDGLSISCAPEMLEQFYRYFLELTKWNARINLTTLTGSREVIEKHFLDSAAYLKAFPEGQGLKILDIGSGGGFPGIPLKILKPSLRLEVADSRNKKLEFIKHLGRILPLEGVKYLWSRCGKETAEPIYNMVVSRACLPVADFFEIAGHYLVPGGRAVLSEGPKAAGDFKFVKKDSYKKLYTVRINIPNSKLNRILLIAEKKP